MEEELLSLTERMIDLLNDLHCEGLLTEEELEQHTRKKQRLLQEILVMER